MQCNGYIFRFLWMSTHLETKWPTTLTIINIKWAVTSFYGQFQFTITKKLYTTALFSNASVLSASPARSAHPPIIVTHWIKNEGFEKKLRLSSNLNNMAKKTGCFSYCEFSYTQLIRIGSLVVIPNLTPVSELLRI